MNRPRDWSPLRGSDPVGGDPHELARLARRYAETAEAINSASRALRTIAESSTVWRSRAGRSFRDRTQETAGTIARAFSRYDGAARALASYARELEQVQDIADTALRRARAARDEGDAARRSMRLLAQQPEPDTAALQRLAEQAAEADRRIRRADDALREAEHDWRAAGRRAADALDEVASQSPLKDGWWDGVLDVVSVVTDVMGKLSAVFGILALICTVVPGLQPFAPVLGGLALATGLVSLAGSTLLYANRRATVSDVLWATVGVVSFGAGRAFALAGRSLALGARGLARPALITSLRAGGASPRQAARIARARGVTGGGRAAKQAAPRAARPSGLWPTRGEWADAYRPRTIFRDVATGPAPAVPSGTAHLEPVNAALRRSRIAVGTGVGAGVVGNADDAKTLWSWSRESRSPAR